MAALAFTTQEKTSVFYIAGIEAAISDLAVQ
jgi:hypothetical protein